jgi:serine/threonine-protein kinase
MGLAAEEGALLAGRYLLGNKVGEGGMGSVFVAEDQELARRVAVKVLRPEALDDPESLARFTSEARAVGKLAHPHIVPLFDFEAEPIPFLVMELVDGESLRRVLNREGKLDQERAVFIARQMLSGLAATHAAGIVHRDVKPSNVMLVKSTAVENLVKLVDFGVAKVSTEGLSRRPKTAEGVIVGTPDYIAPEQMLGVIPDARVDVHGVSVCLFEMLAGYNPFARPEVFATLAAVADLVPPLLTSIDARIHPELARVIAKGLAKNPNDRHASALAMSDALASFAKQAPLPATVPAPALPASAAPALAPTEPPAPLPKQHTAPSSPQGNGTAVMAAVAGPHTMKSPQQRGADGPGTLASAPFAAAPSTNASPPFASPPFATPSANASPPFAAPPVPTAPAPLALHAPASAPVLPAAVVQPAPRGPSSRGIVLGVVIGICVVLGGIGLLFILLLLSPD